MILHQNGLFTLDYTPATDILFVKWPNSQFVVLGEIRQTFQILVENIRNYDIKYLLIDAQHTSLEVDAQEYKATLLQFAQDLHTTRLRKMARLMSGDEIRERHLQELLEQQLLLSFEVQNFEDRTTALAWLTSMN